MLKNILAVITASVSLAGCNSAPSEPPATGQSHTVRRPVGESGPTELAGPGSALGSQPGSAATTETATGIGTPGPGSGGPESAAARSSSIDASPARGTTGP